MSTEVGRHAESVAATFLENEGYRILARNWRTRWCEVDLVVLRAGVVYFVEVKYRRDARWGRGLDYITPKKLQQMHFSADFWMARYPAVAQDYRLAAIEVGGRNFIITAWLDDV